MKTQEFLATAGVQAKTEINAKKETFQRQAALEMVAQANRLNVAKGKKRVDVDLKNDGLTDDEIAKLILGPTGNLRAPTLLVGKTMLVGFNEDMYNDTFG